MSAIATFISPFIVTFLTNITKKHVLSTNSSALIRVVCAILSVILAFLTVWTSGGTIDGSVVTTAVLTVLNFFGSTGIFHLGHSTSQTPATASK